MHPVEVLLVPLGKAFRHRHADKARGLSDAPELTADSRFALVAGAPGIRFVPSRRGPGTYAGPRPVPGHGPHHYRFHLYAIDSRVDLSKVVDAAQLPSALKGHVLASGTLTGTRTS